MAGFLFIIAYSFYSGHTTVRGYSVSEFAFPVNKFIFAKILVSNHLE